MSYDFHLVPRSVGGDALKEAQALFEKEIEEINPGPPVQFKEAKKRQLVAALFGANPQLEPFAFGYSEIAQTYGISEEEARIRYRHVELNGPDNGNGIQISLYDDTADLTVPYWHQPESAAEVFEELWKYLEILRNKGNFDVYDPQLDKILDLDADRGPVLERYGRVVAKMPDIVADAARARKPWWRFW